MTARGPAAAVTTRAGRGSERTPDRVAMRTPSPAALLDAAGRAVLLLTDGGGELLFALPEPAQTELLTRLRSAGVPAQAVDVVRVDVDSLG